MKGKVQIRNSERGAESPQVIDLDAAQDPWLAEMLDDVEPRRDFVLLEQIEQDTTAGGIHIPDSAKEGSFPRHRVLKVGQGERDILGEWLGSQFKPGDVVMLGPSALGISINLPSNGSAPRRRLAQESMIIGVLPGQKRS